MTRTEKTYRYALADIAMQQTAGGNATVQRAYNEAMTALQTDGSRHLRTVLTNISRLARPTSNATVRRMSNIAKQALRR